VLKASQELVEQCRWTQQIKAAEERGDFATSIALKQQRYHQQIQNRS
jgi:hypothetical protein